LLISLIRFCCASTAFASSSAAFSFSRFRFSAAAFSLSVRSLFDLSRRAISAFAASVPNF
jgi:hypothetical protein